MLRKRILILLSVFSLTSVGYSAVDENMLKLMREEEKMSYDLYTEFYQKWGLEIFYSISESEYVHKQRIKELLDFYKIDDPVSQTKEETGKYLNDEVQKKYDEYTVKGSISDLCALMTGALMEETDIYELRERIKIISEEKIIKILLQLEKATQNHLKAFVKNLKCSGIEYKPQVLTQNEFDEIIYSTKDKGTAQR